MAHHTERSTRLTAFSLQVAGHRELTDEGGATAAKESARARELEVLLGGANGLAAEAESAGASAAQLAEEKRRRATSGEDARDGGGLKWSLSWFRTWLANERPGVEWSSIEEVRVWSGVREVLYLLSI